MATDRPQDKAEKIAALRSVLPLLHAHHEMMGAMRVRTSMEGLQSEGGDEGWQHFRWTAPPLPEAQDLAWVERQRRLSRRYRLYAVTLSLQKLERHKPGWAAAIYYTYIEPWTEWNPDRRKEWAENGLEWMAEEIPGEVPPYNPVARPAEQVRQRDAEIERMLHAGISRRAICRALRCGPNLVAAVAKRYRDKETMDA